MAFARPRHWLRWLIGAIAAAAVLAAAGPFIYIHFFNSTPAALSLSPGNSVSASSTASPAGSTASAPSAASGPVVGTWAAGSGSVVG